MATEASFHQICSVLIALKWEESSTYLYRIFIKFVFCNFTLWRPGCLGFLELLLRLSPFTPLNTFFQKKIENSGYYVYIFNPPKYRYHFLKCVITLYLLTALCHFRHTAVYIRLSISIKQSFKHAMKNQPIFWHMELVSLRFRMFWPRKDAESHFSNINFE